MNSNNDLFFSITLLIEKVFFNILLFIQIIFLLLLRKFYTNNLRNFFYGQEDHIRLFSEKQFLFSLGNAGFFLQIKRHTDFFDDMISKYFGVNNKEDLILVTKPSTNNIY